MKQKKGGLIEVYKEAKELGLKTAKYFYAKTLDELKEHSKENTCLVTDALAYAAYEGNEPIDPRYIIEDGVCKMADHSALAGSLATMDVLVRTMVKKANIPLEDAVRMASETPARLIGVSDRKGALAKGKDADIVILDKELNVRCVWSMGKIVPGTDILLHKE